MRTITRPDDVRVSSPLWDMVFGTMRGIKGAGGDYSTTTTRPQAGADLRGKVVHAAGSKTGGAPRRIRADDERAASTSRRKLSSAGRTAPRRITMSASTRARGARLGDTQQAPPTAPTRRPARRQVLGRLHG